MGRFEKYLREYTKNASFHGCGYIGERRTCFESCFWMIILSVAFGGSFYLINETFSKWRDNPVIVSFDTRDIRIFDIPFPGVTICPETKSRQSDYSHSQMIRKLIEGNMLNKTELKRALFMSIICDLNILNYFNYSYYLGSESDEYMDELGQLGYTYNPNEFYSFIYNVSIDFPVRSCKWGEHDIHCSKLFQPMITDEGVCYTFNLLDLSDIFENNIKYTSVGNRNRVSKVSTWNIKTGYLKTSKSDQYPKKALYSGAKSGFSFELVTQKEDIDNLCKSAVQGFRVSLHSPLQIPTPAQYYFSVPLDNIAVVGSVQPKLITTSDLAKFYMPKKRGCYLPKEKKLKWFKVYSQKNCNMQCLTAAVMDVYNCSLFFTPRERDICGAFVKKNLANIERYLKRKNANEKGTDLTMDKSKTSKLKISNCDCLPACTDLSYDVDTSMSNWNWRNMSQMLNTESQTKDDGIYKSKVLLFFKSPEFVPIRRHELYGPTEVIANFGGLLGLFTGFSLLSLMELIYFMTIRICCNIRLYGSWSGRDN